MTALKPDETIESGIRHIWDESFTRVLHQLGHTPLSPEHVHEARKGIKRLRASVRLVRGALGEPTFRSVNHMLRDAGRALSASRDATVLLETFDAVFGKHEQTRVRQSLQAARNATKKSDREAAPRAIEKVKEAQSLLHDCTFAHTDFAAIKDGLQRVYAQGRSALAASMHAQSEKERAVLLHELRKRSKDLTHQTDILNALWPEAMKASTKAYKQLGDLLGDDHDLVILQDALAPHTLAKGKALFEKREAILKSALPQARRLFADRPRLFVGRLQKWFAIWRDHSSLSSV